MGHDAFLFILSNMIQFIVGCWRARKSLGAYPLREPTHSLYFGKEPIMLTQKFLKDILHYDQNTGLVTWLITPSKHIAPGSIAGSMMRNGYIRITIKRYGYAAHRLIWLYMHGNFPPHEIDHINGIKNDNRLLNLRLATKSENGINQRLSSKNTSGYKGVYLNKPSKKWIAQCRSGGKRHHLGCFDTAEEAHAAYKDYAKQHHGCFYRA